MSSLSRDEKQPEPTRFPCQLSLDQAQIQLTHSPCAPTTRFHSSRRPRLRPARPVCMGRGTFSSHKKENTNSVSLPISGGGREPPSCQALEMSPQALPEPEAKGSRRQRQLVCKGRREAACQQVIASRRNQRCPLCLLARKPLPHKTPGTCSGKGGKPCPGRKVSAAMLAKPSPEG